MKQAMYETAPKLVGTAERLEKLLILNVPHSDHPKKDSSEPYALMVHAESKITWHYIAVITLHISALRHVALHGFTLRGMDLTLHFIIPLHNAKFLCVALDCITSL